MVLSNPRKLDPIYAEAFSRVSIRVIGIHTSFSFVHTNNQTSAERQRTVTKKLMHVFNQSYQYLLNVKFKDFSMTF